LTRDFLDLGALVGAAGDPDNMAIDQLDELIAFTETVLREPATAPAPALAPRPPIRRSSAPVPRITAHPAPRRRRRARLVVPILAYALVALPTIAPALRVVVNGKVVEVHARSVQLITAVRRAGLEPVDGALLSAVTHRTLDRHFRRAVVIRGGRVSPLSAAAHSGDLVRLENGEATREATRERRVPVEGGGLPAVEFGLWNPPRAGVTDQLVGIRSGEVVSEEPTVPAVVATPVSAPIVGLTFDDGPNPASTPAILAVLRNAGIKATFCIVGYAARRYPELVKAIRDEGHVLCNHTMHHVQLLGRKSSDTISAEIRDDSDAIATAAGTAPLFFRAPGGTWSANLVDEVHRQGMRALGWNVDPADYERPGVTVILNRILEHVRPGVVVLMHDGGGDRSQTVSQLPLLIERLRRLGYGFGVPTPAQA
jgi:peptidoglycan/xylan/chitin deacetylase (PgdA/CDA1 family)